MTSQLVPIIKERVSEPYIDFTLMTKLIAKFFNKINLL